MLSRLSRKNKILPNCVSGEWCAQTRRFSTSAQKELAYLSGTSKVPLICDTIGGKLRKQAKALGNKPFQIFCQHDVSYTYEEFDQRVDEVAKGFIALGLQKGDRVGMYSPNRPEWALTQYACARADLILVNVNPAFQTRDLKYSLNLVGVKALIMPEQFSHSHYVDIVRHVIPNIGRDGSTTINSEEVPTLKNVIVCDHKKHKGMIQFDELYKMYSNRDSIELEERENSCDYESATNIQFTSGTTGYPKGATLSHHNIMNNSNQIANIMGYDNDTKICLPVPLYHCFGMVMGSLAALNSGGAAVYPCEGFDAAKALKAIDQTGSQAVYGVPIMFNAMANEYINNRNKYSLKTLDRGIMAGSICPENLMKKCNSELGIEFLSNCYGMTETSPVSFQTQREDSFERKTQTVGTIHPHLEVKICGEDGATVRRGEKGEICTRGYSVMLKYWGDEEKTKATLDSNGWAHTGDLGILNDDGYLEIVGRVKDMIIRGGENIFPKEIENYLLTHPNISDAQVIAVNDERMGEEIMACIILHKPDDVLTRGDIKDFLRGQVAHYKIPKYIRIVTEYPLTVTGKVKKNVMRDESNKILEEVDPDDWEYKHNIYM